MHARPFRNPARRTRRGWTLVEVAISSVVVGLMLVGALRAVGAVFMTQARGVRAAEGRALALELAGEAARNSYADPTQSTPTIGLDSGETAVRNCFDDVDDYQGWNASPPVGNDGNALSGCSGWREEAFVKYVQPGALNASSSDTGLKQVQVRITDASGRQTDVYGLRSRRGASEQRTPVDQNYVTWIGCQLQVAPNAPPIFGGTNLLNRARDE